MLRCKPPAHLNAARHHGPSQILRLKPLAQAIALLMMASSAHAATAFSSGWFAAKGAAQAANATRPGGAQVPGMPPPLSQQQRASQQLRGSLSNLNSTVAAIAAQQAAQAAGRQAAFGQVQNVPDGLGEGGLQVDNSLSQGWSNAKGPVQSQSDGKTTVTIEQTADKAILNWETFNVGRNTTVDFQQQADWVVLNRINDPQARPSQIQGQIKGAGTVMLVNRNGVIFSGTSQVNVRNLVVAAATITDDQFSQRGLYFDTNGTQPTFTDAFGKVEVQRGAIIETNTPKASTEAGGYVLLLGSEVENAGSIFTAKGQATLAAGDNFYIRRGVGTSANLRSTTRGNEVATSLNAGSSAGTVTNSGLIQAGDITLTGHQVLQDGVVLASTSVGTRGSVHLLNSATDTTGSVTLGQGSTTAILLDSLDATALDSQRDAALAGLDGTPNNLITGKFDNLSSVVDRGDQSRVEIVSGGTVDFQDGSITLATGGQVAVSAGQRSLVRSGSIIDVSGAVGVKVAMASNSVKVNIQGNEQRDSAGNRDGGNLTSNDVWVDTRELVFVPAGTNGYATDRWYTAGGLLEVSGYLGTQGHSVGEWMAQGGSLTFTGNDVVTQKGAQINLSGGTLDVQSGYVQQSWLRGSDGRLYEVSSAPGDIVYTGIYKGYEANSARWGQTDYFYNPLIAPRQRFESGYTVGRDAGKLVISTNNAVLEGQVIGDVFKGDRQNQAPNIDLDGYQQSQTAAARQAQLIIGNYTPIFDKTSGVLHYNLDARLNQVTVGTDQDPVADGIGLDTAIGSDRQGKLYLDSDQLNGFQLGALKVAAKQGITVNGDLSVANGGEITLYGPQVTVNANLTARSGTLRLGNVLNQVDPNTGKIVDSTLAPAGGTKASVTVADGVHLNASGLWSNLLLDPDDSSGLPYLDGGEIDLRSSGDVNLHSASVVDVSSGGAVLLEDKTLGGKGGDVRLAADAGTTRTDGVLNLDGELRGAGVNGGGTLTLQAHKVVIGDTGSAPEAGTTQLAGDFFNKGFSAYDITGNEGLLVADGTQVDVTQPVYRFGEQANGTASGAQPGTALELWTPPLYQEDPAKGVMTQRQGASLSLSAGTALSSANDIATTALTMGQGSVINVDPGQSIGLRSIGQLTVNGTLNAWGGEVSLTQLSLGTQAADAINAVGSDRSIWLGDQAVIDVAARAVNAVDMHGQTYGQVRNGGKIVIGGEIDPATGTAKAADLFVVVREGARLDASGAQASLDIPGQGKTLVASNGGSISFASNNGLYLDGSFIARAGGAGAAGGTLSVALASPGYLKSTVTDRVLPIRELIIGQNHQASQLPDSGPLVYGQGRLGADQVSAGGFDNLNVFSGGLLNFDGDVSLALGQSLSLYSGSVSTTKGAADNARVRLSAPHLVLSGIAAPTAGELYTLPNLGASPYVPTHATFSVDTDLLDVRDYVTLNFDQVNLSSRGDMRFLAGSIVPGPNSSQFNTQLITPGDMTLRAVQIYPGTGVSASVSARQTGKLIIERVGTATPDVPLSVFGSLQLSAGTIEQGGVVRAPLGLIKIGDNDVTSKVELLPGSITSVSGKGLTLPYGGTIDGQTYNYDGKQVTFLGQSGTGLNGTLLVGVTLGGQSVTVLPDATLDLSGGGDLQGAGFVSGRGGSTDARYNPLVQINPDGTFKLPGLGTNPVYAIVPGAQPGYAPMAGKSGAVDPMIGQQITIGRGVPGLAPGTYTLMPSSYALLPGAFRVELNGLGGAGTVAGAQQMRNGSWMTSGQLSIANTGIRNSLASQVILTSADVLRTYSQYNETSYAQFALADAQRLGVPRPLLPMDAKTLVLSLTAGSGASAFSFQGIGKFAADTGGFGGTVVVLGNSAKEIEIVGPGQAATAQFDGVTVDSDSLNGLGAARLMIGGLPSVNYGEQGNIITQTQLSTGVVLRAGSSLAAPEVFLVSGTGDITVEQGASINTLGQGAAAYDARDGFIYQSSNMLAVSNGLLNVLFVPAPGGAKSGGINIGVCSAAPCSEPTSLYSDGSIVAATASNFELADNVSYGTRHLTLALGNINVGSAEALADAAARNVLPTGLTMSQALLQRLLQGDTRFGAPALETLELSAHDAFNFYGNASLDTYDAQTGKSLLDNLMLTTPAIYGSGAANDVATIHTANLIWNGTAGSPGTVIADGAGTGSGRLDIQTESIEFGYGPFGQPTSTSLNRLALGFASVNLSASDHITSNHTGSLAVYQSQGAYDATSGYAYTGGNLNILTPLMTGEAGSVNHIVAGGAINVASTGATPGDAVGQGAQLSLQGDSITLATAVVLPSGKLTLNATHDLTLTDEAWIDVAGRAIVFNDLTQYGWGGDVVLQSRNGNIRQAAGSRIDLSAKFNHAGQLSAVALDPSAGLVDLQGSILGSSSGYYDAGGTYMPYLAGGVEIQAQRLGDSGTLTDQFAALNQRLNEGQVFGSRSFQLKQGDLTIGDGLKANSINLSLDNGSLLITGTVDASGEQVGSINLSAKHGLTVGGDAVLDAHGSRLRVDSAGKIIDSPNRAMVVLNSGDGVLTLSSGSHIDLRHATDVAVGGLPGQYDGVARGTLELDAPRLGGVSAGDIAIDASGSLDIQGARSIAVNGTWSYNDAAYGTDPAASGRPYQVIDQAYLDAKNLDSVAFINAALGNSDLMQRKLAGLNNARYLDVLHLRPGVEIVSATPDGDLVVQGDIDLSGYRYASINPHTQRTGVYGSGETGSLTLRAGGDLSIYGSITDGFAPPPATQDDKGWQLLPGVDFTGGDIVVPAAGVTLADGTTFLAGTTLNYNLPIKDATLAAGTRLPVAATLAQDMVLPAGTVLAAAIRDSSGNVLFAAGTLLNSAQTIRAGSQLDAGSLLAGGTSLRGFTWPKGVPLPSLDNPGATTNFLSLDGNLALARGSLIPSGTNVKLPAGVDSVQLRPEVAGRQGETWSIAPMLADGSQSWSLRLVAGADITAADSRVVQAFPEHGDLVLADSHYGLFGQALPAKVGFIWTQDASDATGLDLTGQDITDEMITDLTGGSYTSAAAFCVDTPSFCAPKAAFTWTQQASDATEGAVLPGQPITDQIITDLTGGSYTSAAAFCADSPDFCLAAPAPPTEYALKPGSTRFSVIRTGTGDLGLFSGGDVRMDSLFGVYTAGTSSAPTFPDDPYNQPKALGANGTVLNDGNGSYENLVNGGADSVYRAWYPDAGGNLTLKVGGNLTGNIMDSAASNAGRPNTTDTGYDTSSVGNWLWRQGSADVATGGQAQPTAWWINFGSYTAALDGKSADQMVGFTGFGTLGGGNLNVQVAGDAGLLTTLAGSNANPGVNPRSQGLILAVGGTGRVAADGSVQVTGGGDVTLQVGGRLNPASTVSFGRQNGTVVDLRGHVQIDASTVGSVGLVYGNQPAQQSPGEIRPFDVFTATRGVAAGGLTLVPGDATFSLDTLGDLVVQDVADPGRVKLASDSAFISSSGVNGAGISWFSLWTPHTAIDLFSAGGNLTPFTNTGADGAGTSDGLGSDNAIVYPSILRAVAASGSLYYGRAATFQARDPLFRSPLLLAPSDNSQLQLLAGDSIYGGGFTVSQSSAASDAMATPQRPAFVGTDMARGSIIASNLSSDGNRASLGGMALPLFAFGPDTASGQWAGNGGPARFYALTGDLLGVSSGRTLTFTATDSRFGQTWYEGNGPVWMMAGRDIVSSGTAIGKDEQSGNGYTSAGNLFVQNNPNDISIVSAGRDILDSSFNVAGPGTLEITAGRNILMEDVASVTSLGPVVPGDARPGASIVMQAGVGAGGPDYVDFVKAYLDPENQAQAGVPLADQAGKVVKTYGDELVVWLGDRFGFSGSVDEARAYYAGLPSEQQRVFAREVYFDELKAAGREFNEVGGPRQGSYLRGRDAIAALFPDKDVAGNTITYKGDIILFGGAGVHTNFGGDIQMLTPGGGQTFGIEGNAPPSTAGIITQGAGDIQLFSRDSILLGQSRIMTTFGGSILAWAAEGDINAGRGSKTTVVFTPPKRLYDAWGNVTLSPQVPSTGAGIATLNPIPEVAPGDIDLIAPLGTIDAGEAGIRVSGNVNIAALHVVNAANIQVQGKSSGVPVVGAVNTGAITSASAAANSATQAAEDVVRQQQAAARKGLPSVFSVRVVSFGSEALTPGQEGANRAVPAYNPNSPVQVLGAGQLDESALQKLTPDERGRLSL
jgi:filamentous hemagglutinin family protein